MRHRQPRPTISEQQQQQQQRHRRPEVRRVRRLDAATGGRKGCTRIAAAATSAAAALAVVAVLAACGGGTIGSSGNSGSDGSVRLLNATADFTSLDLVSGSTSAAASVASYAVSGYTTLDDGSYAFALRSAGSGVNLVSISASLARKSHTAFVAYVSGGTPAVTALDEDASLPSSGNARLRVLNTASVEAGPLDLYVLPAATPCSAIPAVTPPAASGLTLSSGSAAIDLGVASGGSTYNVCAVAAGEKSDLRLDFPAVAFADRGAATLVLTKTRSGVLVDGLLLGQQGALAVRRNTAARVRVVADLPGGAAVSVTAAPVAGGSAAVTLADALASPNIGSYRLITAGNLALSINGGSAITRGIAAGTDVSLLVAGTTAAAVYDIVDDNTPSTSSSRQTRLRLVNGVAGGASLTVDSTGIADSVPTGGASAASNLVATAGTSMLVATSNGVALPALMGQTLAAGRVYSLFVLNGSAGTPQLTLRADR